MNSNRPTANPDLALFDEFSSKVDSATLTAEELALTKETNEGINGVVRYLNTIDGLKLQAIKEELDGIKEKMRPDNLRKLSVSEISQLLKQYESYQIYFQDVDSRRQLANMLLNPTQQQQLKTALKTHLTNQQLNKEINKPEEIEEKLNALDDLYKDFQKYGRFAALKADELALVAQMVDDLIRAINRSLAKIKNEAIKKEYEKYVAYLMKSRHEIKDCMEQHIARYELNQRLEGSEEEKRVALSQRPVITVDLTRSVQKAPELNNSVMNDVVVVARDIEKDFLLVPSELLNKNNDICLPIRAFINENLFEKKMLPADITSCTDDTLFWGLPGTNKSVRQYFEGYKSDQLPPEDETSYFNQLNLGVAACTGAVGNWIGQGVSGAKQLASGVAATVLPENFDVNQQLEAITNRVSDTYYAFLNPVKYYTPQVVKDTLQTGANVVGTLATVTKTAAQPLVDATVAVGSATLELGKQGAQAVVEGATSVAHMAHKAVQKGTGAVNDYFQPTNKEVTERLIKQYQENIESDITKQQNRKQEIIVEVNETDSNSGIQTIDVFSVDKKVCEWQATLTALANKLEEEIEAHKKSCFSFFFSTHYKEAKLKALNTLLKLIDDHKITKCDELSERAKGLLKDKNVTYGWFSRCERLLKFIAADKLEPKDVNKKLHLHVPPVVKNNNVDYKLQP